MKSLPATRIAATLLLAASYATLTACDQKPAPAKSPTAAATTAADAHDHDHGAEGDHGHEGHDHAKEAASGHGHDDGPMIELGAATIGAFQVKVTRDAGAIKAGGEAAIDATVTGGTAKVAAVRFWIGTQDAKGSMKAKADIEDPKEPSRWHTHVEVPSPLPEGSKVWIEIENDKGEKAAGSVELKA